MPTAMKPIVYRGGVVTFRIPAHWREEYSDMEGGTFYEDRPDSGTLRLTVITMKTSKAPHSKSATEVLQVVENALRKRNVKGTTRGRADGNAVLKYVDDSLEEGTPLTIFYWVVANSLPPRHARIATFSYTVLRNQRNQPHIQDELAMLEAEIETATFSPELGVPGE